jgi:predicted kinase
MVVVITGPIASGKSTVARELARVLEGTNARVEVIDLDNVHDELVAAGQPSSPATWDLARGAAASLANTLLAQGVAVVVAEGSYSAPADRAAFASHLDPGVSPLYVTLSVSFDEALRRAQADPTRGRSRDPGFLRSYFAADEAGGTSPDSDLVIDTERESATSAAAAIAVRVRSQTT